MMKKPLILPKNAKSIGYLLYKPLSDGDYGEVKCITKAAQKYYRKIACNRVVNVL